MSHESFADQPIKGGEPSQKVKDEANLIISLLDGDANSPHFYPRPEYDEDRARAACLRLHQDIDPATKDTQRMSYEDMQQVIDIVKTAELAKRGRHEEKGYDMVVWPCSGDIQFYHDSDKSTGREYRDRIDVGHLVRGKDNLPHFVIDDQKK